jgi:hypothetical protein
MSIISRSASKDFLAVYVWDSLQQGRSPIYFRSFRMDEANLMMWNLTGSKCRLNLDLDGEVDLSQFRRNF